jgi:dihydrodipicolinate synthase/N-acetylneuraminate lyase
MGAFLKERKQVLSKVVREVKNQLEIVQGIQCQNAEEVFD